MMIAPTIRAIIMFLSIVRHVLLYYLDNTSEITCYVHGLVGRMELNLVPKREPIEVQTHEKRGTRGDRFPQFQGHSCAEVQNK